MARQPESTLACCCNFIFDCITSLICWAITLVILIILIVLLIVLLTGRPASEVTTDSAGIFVPFDMNRQNNDTLLWKEPSGEGGLHVEVLNALEEHWLPYFDEYIEKWGAGFQNNTHTVDPLSLSVQRVEIDPECEPVMGKFKACNADYGETNWRGMNIALVDENNYIQHSISKYNDFFVNVGNEHAPVDDNQMKYIMCHELGRGWGLAHTHGNDSDIIAGDCMEYTQIPRRNLHVGEVNLNILHELYGNSERRVLRSRSSQPRVLSEEIFQEYRAAVEVANQDRSCSDCMLDLSDGYRVYIRKLLV